MAKVHIEAGHWIVCNTWESLQILMVLSYPPEKYEPSPLDLQENTKAV